MKSILRQGIATVLCLTGLASCDGGSGWPAFAAENTGALKRVPIAEATGQMGGEPVLIELSSGYGVNLSFIPTGETVEKIWFDNPAIATLDVDGCLSGLGGGGTGGSSNQQAQCQYQGATVLHLRRINSLNFPNLPKTNSTLLTAITHGRTGRHIYLFRVALGGTSPKYHTVEVVPDVIATATRYRSVVDSITDWQLFNRGLTVAEQKRLVRRSQPLYGRIQNFLFRVKGGEQIESAAAASGVSLSLVRRLEELGRSDVSVPASNGTLVKGETRRGGDAERERRGEGETWRGGDTDI